MKSIQKISSIILTITILGSLISIPAFAANNNVVSNQGTSTGDYVGKYPTTAIKKTQEELELEKQKMAKAMSLFNDNRTYAATPSQVVYKIINVPTFRQETGYYCGPATTKEILHSIKGSSASQGAYASQLGTTSKNGTYFPNLVNVINKNQSKFKYGMTQSPDFNGYMAIMNYIVSDAQPGAVDLRITPKELPTYTSNISGHIICVSGLASDFSKIRLTDPYDQGGRGKTIGDHWYKFDGVYRANMAHPLKAIIW